MFGDFGKMMKMAVHVRQKLPEVQRKLEAGAFEAAAGGGAVRAVVNGRGTLTDLKISDELLAAGGGSAVLVELLKAAISAAQARAAQAAQEAMAELTGGLPLAGLEGMM